VTIARVLAFDDEQDPAGSLARALDVPLSIIVRHRFPDGELKLRLPAALNGSVVLWRGLHQPNEKLVELMIAAPTARELGARQLLLVCPYLAYMRQDIAFAPGEAVSQRHVGRLLAQAFETVITVDPHLHRVASLDAVLPGSRGVALSAAGLLGAWAARNVPDPLLLGPDEESAPWVRLAMTYQGPSIADTIADCQRRGIERICVLPLYPQYSATTTATVFDAVSAEMARCRNVPELRTVRHFHDHPGYIDALRLSVLEHWRRNGSLRDAGGKLVMSFHGVPKRTLDLGDPYHCECRKTGRLLGEALGLSRDEYVVTFQSRFGKAEWLQPYTAPTLHALGQQGVARVDVICPGFAADCLETLEEINIEGRQEFLAAGGKDFHYIACLNESPAFIHALADLAASHLQGWPVARELRGALDAAAAKGAVEARLAGAPR